MARVLVVEGDAPLRFGLADELRSSGHDVELAASAEFGLGAARAWQPGLVLVGMTTDATPAALCAALRRDPATRHALLVIMGGSSDEEQRVSAFEAGADDYVVEPFSHRELLLRVRALLRRGAARPAEDFVSIGPLRIERASRRVTVGEERVELTRREFDLLLRLAEGHGRVLTRSALVEEVWPDGTPSPRVVDTTLKRVRRKLGGLGAWIRTVRGIGYQLSETAV